MASRAGKRKKMVWGVVGKYCSVFGGKEEKAGDRNTLNSISLKGKRNCGACRKTEEEGGGLRKKDFCLELSREA